MLLKSKWILVISSGLFLGFVLYIYKAFGIDEGISFSGHTFLERSVLFAFGVSATYAFNEFFLVNKFTLRNNKAKILWVLWEIWSGGSITFLFFNYFWNFTESSWYSYTLLLGEFTTVMLVPHAFSMLMARQLKSIKFDKHLTFKSENEKEQFTIAADKLLYIKADDNYVGVFFEENGIEKSTILRNKLSFIERNFTQLVRVHRSYLINPKSVLRIDKKPKSMKVYFQTGNSIPVSNSYLKNLEKILGE